MEKELSEITRGFAEIKGHDQQALEDRDEIMESSQPSINSPGSSDDDTLEDAVETIEDDTVVDEVLQDALEYVVEETADTSLEDNLVQELSGLVFSTKGDDEKEGN